MIKPIQSGSYNARYLLVAEAPGQEEDEYRRPLIGVSGWETYSVLEESGWIPRGSKDYIVKALHPWYDSESKRMRLNNPNFLPLDRTLDEASIFITNIAHSRPPGNDINLFFAKNITDARRDKIPLVHDRYPLQPIIDGIAQLQKDIDKVRPTIIIALGNTALWALTGLQGITKWRGSILMVAGGPVGDFGIKVIPTFHPADILRTYNHRFVVIRDLKRALYERDFPEVREKPSRYIIHPSFAEAMEWLDEQSRPERAEEPLGADIETPWGWWNLIGHIACMGFSTSRTDAICIPLMCVDDKEGYWPPEQEVKIVLAMRRLMELRPCIFHKGIFDVVHIIRHWGFFPRWTDDTMVMMHVRFPGLMGIPKLDPITGKEKKKGSSLSLVFSASLFCEYYRAWKDEGKNWNTQEAPNEDGWWSYNCLRGDTLIETNLGFYKIEDIVNNRLKVKVKSINEITKEIEWKNVTKWYRNDYNNKITWMLITVEERNGTRTSLTCTFDHEILCSEGRKQAVLVTTNDFIHSGNGMFVKVISTASFVSNDEYKYSQVSYCISVEDNKNFLTLIGFVSNCDDTTNMFEVFEVQRDALRKENLWRQYRFMMSLAGPILDMMIRGFRIDLDMLKMFRGNVKRDIHDLQTWISAVCGHDVNTGSPVQMQKLFYDDFALKKVTKGRGRKVRSTIDANALETLAKRNPVLGPLCFAVSDKNSLEHFKNNMLDIRLDTDGHARCEINPTGTQTLRFASTGDCFGKGLNLQNLNRMPEPE